MSTRTHTVHAVTLSGLRPLPIRIEASALPGPGAGALRILGLAEHVERETRVRVLSAFAHMGHPCVAGVTVLVVGDVATGGSAPLDLPIAVAVAKALGMVPDPSEDPTVLLGELALDGTLRGVRGALARLTGLSAPAIVPSQNTAEAAMAAGDAELYEADTLTAVLDHLDHWSGRFKLHRIPRREPTSDVGGELPDESIRDAQPDAVRVLREAARTGQGVLLTGPPGAGKTILARALARMLPAPDASAIREMVALHGIVGLLPERRVPWMHARPFRAPHHSVSEAGLIGGGTLPRPGEVTLAHHGVLFLDELAEFRRSTLQALAEVLRRGEVMVARSREVVRFPAKPLLIAATAGCPCGWANHPRRGCQCTAERIARYMDRIAPISDLLPLRAVVVPS